MRDDRPLYVLASRAAHIFGLPLLDARPGYPDAPPLRAMRVNGKVVTAQDGKPAPMFLTFGRGLDGGTSWQLVATDGAKYRRVIVEGRTAGAFRAAFDAAERALEASAALRPWRTQPW